MQASHQAVSWRKTTLKYGSLRDEDHKSTEVRLPENPTQDGTKVKWPAVITIKPYRRNVFSDWVLRGLLRLFLCFEPSETDLHNTVRGLLKCLVIFTICDSPAKGVLRSEVQESKTGQEVQKMMIYECLLFLLLFSPSKDHRPGSQCSWQPASQRKMQKTFLLAKDFEIIFIIYYYEYRNSIFYYCVFQARGATYLTAQWVTLQRFQNYIWMKNNTHTSTCFEGSFTTTRCVHASVIKSFRSKYVHVLQRTSYNNRSWPFFHKQK